MRSHPSAKVGIGSAALPAARDRRADEGDTAGRDVPATRQQVPRRQEADCELLALPRPGDPFVITEPLSGSGARACGGAPWSGRDHQPAAVGPAGTGEILAYCVS